MNTDVLKPGEMKYENANGAGQNFILKIENRYSVANLAQRITIHSLRE
jgi:hypothetical protein